MYSNIFEELGLAKNEARIYETLIKEGELGVGAISTKSGVHRRNAYDSLNRLMEKGLVFQTITSTEHRYHATDPKKLLELVKEKEEKVVNMLPALEALFKEKPHMNDTFVYRGVEGWKNYMRDVARIGEDVYAIGMKGTWEDPRLAHLFTQTTRAMKEKGIVLHLLIDTNTEHAHTRFEERGVTVEHRLLPKGFETSASVDIFGDHIVMLTNPTPGSVIDDMPLTVLINPLLADAFRTWFGLLWKAAG